MKDKTLKAFYYGNLTPGELSAARDSMTSRAVSELSGAEDLLAQALPPELRPALDRLLKAQSRLNSIAAETSYIDGFKTGARFVMEILDDSRENLKPIIE